MKRLVFWICGAALTLAAGESTTTAKTMLEQNISSPKLENNVSRDINASIMHEPSVLTPQKSYRWFDGDTIRGTLDRLLRNVEEDETLLCKEKLPYRHLKELVENYRVTHDAALKESIEYEANKLESMYQDIKSKGCYEPQQFLEDNYIPPKKETSSDIANNPVLNRLYDALQKYRAIEAQGGWQHIEVKDIPYLRPGHRYDILPEIKKRLKIEGYYPYEDNSTRYDAKFTRAVREFQKHHALKSDGVIGPATLDKLNIPVEEKIRKILINIERARWFLRNDDYFVFVDIPGFFMQVYDHGKPIFYSRVVVGRKKRPSPQMRNTISYAVLNPYWRAPKTIIQKDIWPKLQKGDFDALRASGIVAAKDYKGEKIVEYEEVDWSQYSEDRLPFIFLQKPGPHNFLGYVKFMFPNRFDVYLHDTNHKNLFRYRYRALSSGCIRVEKPLELFHLFRNHMRRYKTTYRDILELLADGRTKIIRFRPIIPVYLLYLTVYEDDKGHVFFFRDIYDMDKNMLSGLQKFDTIASK